jgi:transcriptional regulator with XRE-family HTH domain
MPLVNKVVLGTFVKQYREGRGWTVRKLAAKAGITNSHVSKIELAQLNIGLETFCRVAKAFEVSAPNLLRRIMRHNGADEPHRPGE